MMIGRPNRFGFAAGVFALAWLGMQAVPGQIVEEYGLPDVAEAAANTNKTMPGVIRLYSTDRTSVQSSAPVPRDERYFRLMDEFNGSWLKALGEIDFQGLERDGQVDYILLRHQIESDQRALDTQEKEFVEIKPLMPFAEPIIEFERKRRRMEPFEPAKLAEQLTTLAKEVDDATSATRNASQRGRRGSANSPAGQLKPEAARRARTAVGEVRQTLNSWYNFYAGYDPLFTWWVAEPKASLEAALTRYAAAIPIRESDEDAGARAGGSSGGGGGSANDTDGADGDGELEGLRGARAGGAPRGAGRGGTTATPGTPGPIRGTPVGRDRLVRDLAEEMIVYTPEELIAFAEEHLKWCREQMIEASRQMGYGDDWKKALEKIKDTHVEPGEQPRLIYDVAHETIDFVKKNDIITIPDLALEGWRIGMMSAAAQVQSPFFTGGAQISVSFPTNEMPHENKIMSLRGNNSLFAHAAVLHEVIPGHYLQQFMNARYNTHRRLFGTPFWTEGGALYWELVFWDKGFQDTPEERLGAMFWRGHRCARIIFSLKFHLGQMTAQECVDMLVNDIGHERANADGEVRRSFGGGYGPLYQAAYLLGGLQLYSLRHEIVDTGRMTDLQFNDRVFHGNGMPIEMVRALLDENVDLTRDYKPNWRFLDDIPESRGF